MKYVSYGAEGSAESMVLAEAPAPLAGPGEILIEVACAGVNRPDLMQRAGRYPPPPGASPILGLEVAGRVAARGRAGRPRPRLSECLLFSLMFPFPFPRV